VPAPKYKLRLLGRFELSGPDGSVELSNRKLAALLAYLACTAPKPQSRDTLATLLWGSHFEAQAKQNLRQALVRLRRALDPDAVISDGDEISLAPGVVACDALRLAALGSDRTRTALAEAAELYKGRLLADVAVPEEAWTDWLTGEQERLEGLGLGALIGFAELELSEGRADKALETAHRVLAINELREDAHRLVVQGLTAAGRRAEALKHYQDLVALLKRELSTEPDAATKALVAELRSVQPAIELPDKPSIAVLPFTNMSGDPQQEYFADGIVDDIITELSRFRSLFVIARNSSFTYKGKSVDVRRIAADLGVRYVLEGSVRREGNRVRVTAQLIDAPRGGHLWAERYDRELADVFAVQEEITHNIVASIAPELEAAELALARRARPNDVRAYEIAVRAWADAHAAYSGADPSGRDRAMAGANEALRLDPSCVLAWVVRTSVHWLRVFYRVGPPPEESLRDGIEAARQAIALDRLEHRTYQLRGMMLLQAGEHDAALADLRRAHELNPNDANALQSLGYVELMCGEPGPAEAHLRASFRLNPQDPTRFNGQTVLGNVCWYNGNYDEGVEWGAIARRERPGFVPALFVIMKNLVGLGRLDEARAVAAEIRRIAPAAAGRFVSGHFSTFRRRQDCERELESIRRGFGVAPPAAQPLPGRDTPRR
jgi:TolB-like protein